MLRCLYLAALFTAFSIQYLGPNVGQDTSPGLEKYILLDTQQNDLIILEYLFRAADRRIIVHTLFY
jgi:hypothetical protein